MQRLIFLLCLFAWPGVGFGAETANSPKSNSEAPLEDQLKALDAANQAPAGVNREKLYSVQTRYLPLTNMSEVKVSAAMNLTPDSFLRSQQAEVGYRFHFSDRWALGADYGLVANQFKSEVSDIKNSDGVVPEVPYARARTDLLVEFNAFYGKFRWTADTVSYFDQYWALGPGLVQTNTGEVGAGVVDAGFAFWLGRWGSFRAGVKDYVYNESYRTSSQLEHNVHAHLDLGYLF